MNHGRDLSGHNVRIVSRGSTNPADTWKGFEGNVGNVVSLVLVPELNPEDVREGFRTHKGLL